MINTKTFQGWHDHHRLDHLVKEDKDGTLDMGLDWVQTPTWKANKPVFFEASAK